MLVLGIESSHDDTGIALIKDLQIIFNYQISQIALHQQYGGTIPELASREHYHNFYLLLNKILNEQKKWLNQIDYIAYTKEPGLIGALQMGQIFAQALAQALNKPLQAINHLDGHIFSVLLHHENETKPEIIYPALALIVSGGHSNLYYLKSACQKELLSQTLDDAVGEVFDKVGRILNLDFPGGPQIDRLFQKHQKADFQKFQFKWPQIKTNFDFSFSGFKTQALHLSQKEKPSNYYLIAIAFQKAVIDYLINQVKKVLKDQSVKTLILAGGVSANSYLRTEFLKLHHNVLLPKLTYATDNGAMIALAWIEQLKNHPKLAS